MSYCVKCGVELNTADEKCPLCGTRVYLPEEKHEAEFVPIFPLANSGNMPKPNKKSFLELISLIFFLPIPVLILCDVNISDGINWSGFAVGAIFVLYIILVFPFIPKRGNAVVSILADLICTLAYLFYIEYVVGGTWFLRFAMPLTMSFWAFVMIIALFRKYTKISNLTLTGMSLLFTGIFCLIIEFLINASFGIYDSLNWSFYPALSLAVCAIIIFYINSNATLKEKIRRKLII